MPILRYHAGWALFVIAIQKLTTKQKIQTN